LICCANVELAPKFSYTVTPGCAVSNCLAKVVNDSFSEEAANTVTVPDNVGALDVAPPPALADVVLAAADVLRDEPQPAASMTAAAAAAPMARVLRCIDSPQTC
jgi:hypothetical protein